MVPKQNERTFSVMAFYYGVKTLSRVNVNINAQKYIDILDYYLWPVFFRQEVTFIKMTMLWFTGRGLSKNSSHEST